MKFNTEPNMYQPTAYDSRRDGLPPHPADRAPGTRFLEREVHKRAILGRGLQCREYLADLDERVIDYMEEDSEEAREIWGRPNHRQILWRPITNPRAFVDVFGNVFGAFSAIGILSSIILIFVVGPTIYWLEGVFFSVFLPFFIYKISRVALRKNWVKDRNNTIFDRCTGMVEFSRRFRRYRLPFREFEPAIRSMGGASFQLTFHLLLYHRKTNTFVMEPGGHFDYWKAELAWERLQQFMDTAYPLPELPDLEPYRHLDPTTAEHDRQSGRPKTFWRGMDRELAVRLRTRARAAATTFPWGYSRERALAMGWQPSGVGDGEPVWLRAEEMAQEAGGESAMETHEDTANAAEAEAARRAGG